MTLYELNTKLGNIQFLGFTHAAETTVSIPASGNSGQITFTVPIIDGADGYSISVSHAIPYATWCLQWAAGGNSCKGTFYNPTSTARSGKVWVSALAYKILD